MFGIRKLDFVVALYIFGVLCAELMGAKTFPIARIDGLYLTSSVAIFVMPILFILPDVVVEVYGRSRARSLVFSGMTVIVLLLVLSAVATHVPPTPRFAASNTAYNQILGYSARMAGASLAAFSISELLDIVVFSRLRKALRNRALWLRIGISNFMSQFMDSAVFLTLAFYAVERSVGSNVTFLLGLLLPYWLLRCGMAVASTPLAYAGVAWLRSNPQLEASPISRVGKETA